MVKAYSMADWGDNMSMLHRKSNCLLVWATWHHLATNSMP